MPDDSAFLSRDPYSAGRYGDTAPPRPVDAKTAIDSIASQTRVPANVLHAFVEATQAQDDQTKAAVAARVAEGIAPQLQAGKNIEDVILGSAKDEASGRQFLERARQIGHELYPDQMPEEPGAFERLGKAFEQGEAAAITRGQDMTRDTAAALEESALGRTLAKMRRAVGVDDEDSATPEERAQAIRDAPRSEGYEGAQANLERMAQEGFEISDWRDIRGLASMSQFMAENVATSLPQMGATLASGPMSAPVTIALLGGEANEELKERTELSEGERVSAAMGAGTAMWALETIGLGKVVGGLVPSEVATRAMRGELADHLVKGGIKRSAARVIEAGIVEGSTEALQEGIVMATTGAAGGEYSREEVTERLTTAFAAGSGAGAGIRTAVEPFAARGGPPADTEEPEEPQDVGERPALPAPAMVTPPPSAYDDAGNLMPEQPPAGTLSSAMQDAPSPVAPGGGPGDPVTLMIGRDRIAGRLTGDNGITVTIEDEDTGEVLEIPREDFESGEVSMQPRVDDENVEDQAREPDSPLSARAAQRVQQPPEEAMRSDEPTTAEEARRRAAVIEDHARESGWSARLREIHEGLTAMAEDLQKQEDEAASPVAPETPAEAAEGSTPADVGMPPAETSAPADGPERVEAEVGGPEPTAPERIGKKNGDPFGNAAAAKRGLRSRGLDPQDFEIIEVEGGVFAVPKTDSEFQQPGVPEAAAPPETPEPAQPAPAVDAAPETTDTGNAQAPARSAPVDQAALDDSETAPGSTQAGLSSTESDTVEPDDVEAWKRLTPTQRESVIREAGYLEAGAVSAAGRDIAEREWSDLDTEARRNLTDAAVRMDARARPTEGPESEADALRRIREEEAASAEAQTEDDPEVRASRALPRGYKKEFMRVTELEDESGGYRVSLRRDFRGGDIVSEYGIGATPEQAVENAVQNIDRSRQGAAPEYGAPPDTDEVIEGDDAAPASPSSEITRRDGSPFGNQAAARRGVRAQGGDPEAFTYEDREGGIVAVARPEGVEAQEDVAETPTEPAAQQPEPTAEEPPADADTVAAAAAEAEPEPTEGQKQAGNYRMGHFRWNGLDITIENAKGSERRGTGPDGAEWSVTMPAAYGYIRRTEGADGDHVDVYIGDNPESDQVYIVDQQDADTGTFDEHKAILGTTSEADALDLYRAGFSDGQADARIRSISATDVEGLKDWLENGDQTSPAVGHFSPVEDDPLSADQAQAESTAAPIAEPEPDAAETPAPEDQNPIKNDPAEGESTETPAEEGEDTPTEAEPARTTDRIEDFGERIEGAAKDVRGQYLARIGDVAKDDIEAQPLSKSFPEPSYQALIDEGASPWAVGFIRASRDAIPNKPRAAWKLDGWASQVSTLREVAEGLLDGGISEEAAKEQLTRYPRIRRDIEGGIELYQALGHDRSLKGLRLNEARYSMKDGKRHDPPLRVWEVTQKAKATGFSNMPRILASGDTKEAAIEAFRKVHATDAGGKKTRKKPAFRIYRKRGEEGVFVGVKIGRDHVDLKRFETTSAARGHLNDHHDELAAQLERMRDTPAERKAENSPRVGADHRAGADVTPEVFASSFGFRGVQFGNWVENTRRQADLNEAYDALHDLAGVLGVPPRALSLNGELGLAFGARGKGGKNPAAAHYEPGQVVINLTKRSGAGSLAHEWFHALDNAFERSQGRASEYVTQTTGSRRVGPDVRPEIIAAFRQVADAIRETGIPQRSKRLDRTRAKEYWSKTIEVHARAFESYVIARLQEQSGANDYLANVVGEGAFKAEAAMRGIEGEVYPYATAAEVPAIRDAFDGLFQTIRDAGEGPLADAPLATSKDQAVYGTPLDIFYSPVLRAVESAKQAAAPPKDWKAILNKAPNVKRAEMDWLGVDDWLDAQDGQVPREALAEFVRGSQIEVVEEIGAEMDHDPSIRMDLGEVNEDGEQAVYLYDDVARRGRWEAEGVRTVEGTVEAEDEFVIGGQYFPNKQALWDWAEEQARIHEAGDSDFAARFAEYSEDGGTNYREILLRMPNLHESGANRGQWAYDMDGNPTRGLKRPFVQRSHFEQENIVVHARVKDREGPNGERVLFAEEIQSDLGSRWREESESPEVTARRRELIREYDGLRNKIVDLSDATAEEIKQHLPSALSIGNISDDIDSVSASPNGEWSGGKSRTLEAMREHKPEVLAQLVEMSEKAQKAQAELLALGTERSADPRLPRTPFENENYYALMVKRLMRMAAEEGYDRLSWTPGYMQAERWNAAAQSVVEGVRWGADAEALQGEHEGGKVVSLDMGSEMDTIGVLVDADGKITRSVHQGENLVGKSLPQLVGPSLTQDILTQPTGSVSGQKITFPDSGYAIAYDQHIRKSVEKLAKKNGARVRADDSLPDMRNEAISRDLGRATIGGPGPETRPVWSVDITDGLRSAAMEPLAILQQPIPTARHVWPQVAKEALPRLRSELDRLGLRRVALALDESGRNRQGAFEASRYGAMDILIGASLDPDKTLYHESIHAMRAMNLFSEPEWTALSEAAGSRWIENYDIEARYPHLSREEQTEEAVAEAFAEYAAVQEKPKHRGVIRRALERIGRLLQAVRGAFAGQSPEDVFMRAFAGEIGARQASNTGIAKLMESRSPLDRWRGALVKIFSQPNAQMREARVGAVGPVLRHLGVPDGTIYMSASKLRQITKQHPEAHDALMQLPALLADPDAVVSQNRDDSDYRIVTSARAADGKPIVANLKVDGTTPSGNQGRIVMTVHAWRDAERGMRNAAQSGSLIYLRDSAAGRGLGLRGEDPLTASPPRARRDGQPKVVQRADVLKSSKDQAPATEAMPQAEITGEERKWISQRMTDALGGNYGALGLVPGRGLFEELGKNLPSSAVYLRSKEEMDALRQDWHQRMDDVAQDWRKLFATSTIGRATPAGRERNRERQDANAKMMDLMHDATLAGVDPSRAFVAKATDQDPEILRAGRPGQYAYDAAAKRAEEDKQRRTRHRELARRFRALPKAYQEMFERVRDTYTELSDAFDAAILAHVEKSMQVSLDRAERQHRQEMERIRDEGLTGEEKKTAEEEANDRLAAAKKRNRYSRNARLANLRATFETNRLDGPYFPLARFGDFYVTVRDKASGQIVSFSRFERTRSNRLTGDIGQQEFAAEMRQNPDYDVEVGTLAEGESLKDQVDPNFVADVEAMIGQEGGDAQLMDAVWQRWLETLPDLSQRKRRIHRKGTPGYAEDAFRAFGQTVFHGSHQLARLSYAADLQRALENAREEAKQSRDPVRSGLVVNEMERRHEFVMNPTNAPWTAWATSAAFVWYLGVTPAAAIVNLSQTSIVGIPIMTARYRGAGATQVSRQLGRALGDFTRGKGDTARSKRLTDDERDAMDQFYRRGLIERTQAHDLAQVADSGVKYSAFRTKWMGRISFFFHHAERLNREVTGLAAYRLGRAQGLGHTEAIEKASSTTWGVHFDYQNSSRARVLQHDVTKVAFVFKNFAANMLWRLFRDAHQSLKGATADERVEARTQLIGTTAMLMLHGGLQGVWGYALLSSLVGLFFDDGGDDVDELLQTALVDTFGPDVAGMFLRGVPGHLLGVDLTSRVGMADLWFRAPDRNQEGEELYTHYVNEVLGAVPGIASNMIRGVSMARDGEAWRGIETASPKAIKDVMQATRYMTEGVTTYRGDPLLEEVNPYQVLVEAMGFTPAEISERYRQNRRMYNEQTRIQDERRDILRSVREDLKGAGEISEGTMAQLLRFNRQYPFYPIKGENIAQSVRSAQRSSARNQGGAILNPRLDQHIRDNAAPGIY